MIPPNMCVHLYVLAPAKEVRPADGDQSHSKFATPPPNTTTSRFGKTRKIIKVRDIYLFKNGPRPHCSLLAIHLVRNAPASSSLHRQLVFRLPVVLPLSLVQPIISSSPCVRLRHSSSFKSSTNHHVVSTSDSISLAFGLAGTFIALAAIVVATMVRNRPSTSILIHRNHKGTNFNPLGEQDIEMQPLTPPHNEHEIALRAVETVLALFRNRT